MGKIGRFEDITAWQKARELVKAVYHATNSGRFAKDYGLRDQVRRAAVSIMLNIAEGFARKTDREFAQFLVVAHGSAAEVQAALYVALDQGYLSQLEFKRLYDLAEDASRLIMGFSTYLRQGTTVSSSRTKDAPRATPDTQTQAPQTQDTQTQDTQTQAPQTQDPQTPVTPATPVTPSTPRTKII